MVTCDHALELINMKIDLCITNDDDAVLQEHLLSCEDCRAVYASYTAIQEGLLSFEEETPAGFAGTVMFRVRNEKQNKRRVNRGAVALAACAAAVALVVSFVGMSGLFAAKSADNAAPMMKASGTAAQSLEAERVYDAVADSDAGSGMSLTADAPEAECDCAPADAVFVPNAGDYAVVVTVENKEELEAYARALVFEYGPEGEWCIISVELAQKIRDNLPSAKYHENFDPVPGGEALILILP